MHLSNSFFRAMENSISKLKIMAIEQNKIVITTKRNQELDLINQQKRDKEINNG